MDPRRRARHRHPGRRRAERARRGRHARRAPAHRLGGRARGSGRRVACHSRGRLEPLPGVPARPGGGPAGRQDVRLASRRSGRRRRERDRGRASARRGRGICGRPRQRDRVVREHRARRVGDRAPARARLPDRLRGPLPREAARLHVRDPGACAGRAARHGDGGRAVPDGDDLRVDGLAQRWHADDPSEPRRALGLLQGRGADDGERDAAGRIARTSSASRRSSSEE